MSEKRMHEATYRIRNRETGQWLKVREDNTWTNDPTEADVFTHDQTKDVALHESLEWEEVK